MAKPSNSRQTKSRARRITSLVLRITQASSSLVVVAILYYFFLGLHSRQPFFLLLSAAGHLTLLQLLAFVVLAILKRQPPPLAQLGCNGAGCLLWAAGVAGLTFYDFKHQLLVKCSGHIICTLYKLLFAFALLGLISTLIALLIQLYLFRRARWTYQNLNRNLGFEPPLHQEHQDQPLPNPSNKTRYTGATQAKGKDSIDAAHIPLQSRDHYDVEDDDDDDEDGMEMIAPLRSPSPPPSGGGGGRSGDGIGGAREAGRSAYNPPMISEDMDPDHDIAYHGRRGQEDTSYKPVSAHDGDDDDEAASSFMLPGPGRRR